MSVERRDQSGAQPRRKQRSATGSTPTWEQVLELQDRANRLSNYLRAAEHAARVEQSGVEGAAAVSAHVREQATEAQAARAEARRAWRRHVIRFVMPRVLGGWAILLALAAANHLAFSALGSDYLGWFVDNGAVISIVVSLIFIAVTRDALPGLIAAEPWGFVQAVVDAALGNNLALLGVFASARPDRQLEGTPASDMTSRWRWIALDRLVAKIFTLSLFAAMAAWALVVAPLQYWVNLVCGAPARAALASQETAWIERKPKPEGIGSIITYRTGPKDELPAEGATELSFATQPVTLTYAIAAAFLWGLGQIV
jgi:hypothetical protein